MTISVLAYNLYFGGTDRLDAIQAVLAQANADLVCLTEADDRAVVDTLAQRLGYTPIWARGSGDRHIATLSKFPVRQWHIHNRPPLTQAVLETTVDLPGDQGLLTLYNTHFLPYLLLPFEIRRWQAVGKLIQVIRQRQPGPHLILGDLNAVAPGDQVLQRNNPPRMRRVMLLQLGLIFRLALRRLLAAGYTDCFRKLHPTDPGFTWMPGNLTTRYDYIFADVSLSLKLKSCRVLKEPAVINQASDHFPLFAEFQL